MKIHLIPIANVIQFNGRRSRHCEKRSDEAIHLFSPAFSLIELLIALALSAVIMIGMVQGNRNAAYLLREAQALLIVNRQVALLYNQLERDVTAAIVYQKPIPYPPAKARPKKKEGEKQEEKTAPPQPPEEQASTGAEKGKVEKNKFVSSCVLEAFDEGVYKVGTKKWQQTKRLSFITTTPLEVYEQEHERSVRVGYELVYDKTMSTPQKSVYTLYRLQTDELENVAFKEDESKKVKSVLRYVVADHIKQFSLEALYDLRPPQAKDSSGKSAAVEAPIAEPLTEEGSRPTQLRTFTWGEKEETEKSKTVLPDMFATHIEVWDGALQRSYSFTSTFPVFVKTEAKQKQPKKKDGMPAGAPVEPGAPNAAPKTPEATAPAAKEGAQ
ncbi:MAG: hypothetical protein QG632_45 [Candidatus Dependentiae bacterium]|nr:hypothetical protein [Candidatus Dependentiae bacterium]